MKDLIQELGKICSCKPNKVERCPTCKSALEIQRLTFIFEHSQAFMIQWYRMREKLSELPGCVERGEQLDKSITDYYRTNHYKGI